MVSRIVRGGTVEEEGGEREGEGCEARNEGIGSESARPCDTAEELSAGKVPGSENKELVWDVFASS